MDTESVHGAAAGADRGEKNLNMQERILTRIPNPEKAIKGNEILSCWQPVVTKVGCTWKNL